MAKMRYSTLVVGTKEITETIHHPRRKKEPFEVVKKDVPWEIFHPGQHSTHGAIAQSIGYGFKTIQRVELWQIDDKSHIAKIVNSREVLCSP